MTEQPETPGGGVPDRGLPMAGRQPPPGAADDEPTVRTTPPRDDVGEQTTVLRPPAEHRVSGEETTRLQPPADRQAQRDQAQRDQAQRDQAQRDQAQRDGTEPTTPPAAPGPRAEPPADPSARDAGGPTGPHGGPSAERVTGDAALLAVPEDLGPGGRAAPWRRLSSAGALIWVLLALFGFTLVVQLRSNDGDQGLASARQEDLVRILSDLESRDGRLQTEIGALETSQRQLTSGVAGRQAALAEAEKRTDELGLLAGTLRGRGPGLEIAMDKVKASAVLNTVQELRGSGGEVMEIAGANGNTVRIVASSYFVDAQGGGLVVDGSRLTGPYTVRVIGSPQIMQTALRIPGGVLESVNSGGGSVTMEVHAMVEVTTVRKATTLQYARPVS
jgi:uncharacterized protein YlxW (UPF0749 family)